MAIKIRSITLFTGLLALSVMAVAVSAQDTATAPADGVRKERRFERKGSDKGRKFRRHGMKHRMSGLSGIQLSDAQKEQLKAFREANKPSLQDREMMKGLADARRSGTLTEEQKAQLSQLRDARREKMRSFRSQMDAILTPEQKAQIEARKAERKQHSLERRQKIRERFKDRQPGPRTTPETKPDNN